MTVMQSFTCDVCKRPSLKSFDMIVHCIISDGPKTEMLDVCNACVVEFRRTIADLIERHKVKS